MAIWFCVASFLMGGAISFCVTWTLTNKKKNEAIQEMVETESKLAKEWMNFLSYNGGSGGQINIEN